MCVWCGSAGAENEGKKPLQWKSVMVLKERSSAPNTTEPLIFCFGNFKDYKRNWQEAEEIKNVIVAKQKEYRGYENAAATTTEVKIDSTRAMEIAKETFKKNGFGADDELDMEQFNQCLVTLGFHMSMVRSTHARRTNDRTHAPPMPTALRRKAFVDV